MPLDRHGYYGFELPDFRLQHTGIEGIDFLLRRRRREMAQAPANYGFMRLEDWRWQPEFIRMMQAVRDRAGQDCLHEGMAWRRIPAGPCAVGRQARIGACDQAMTTGKAEEYQRHRVGRRKSGNKVRSFFAWPGRH